MVCCALLAAVFIYPTVARTGSNLLASAAWSHSQVESGVRAFGTSTGGPFSATGKVWRAETFKQTYAYWNTSAKLKPDHEYLAGYWVRFSNATTMLWTHGRNAATGAGEDYRLYCKAGFQACLKPYISEDVARKLCGDPGKWRLCFRMLRFPQGLDGGTLYFSAGCYASTGAMEFAEPFLVDVTGCEDRTLTIELCGCRLVARLELFRVGIRDLVWTKKFERPVTDCKLTVPSDLADYRLGQEESANVINGHGLDIFYVDGTSETAYAPEEHVYRVRTDY